MSKAAIYADINPNAIDGSSIWMMSITEVLSGVFDKVSLILKTEPIARKLVSAIEALPNVEIDFLEAFPNGSSDGQNPVELSISQAARRIDELHRELSFDAIIARGVMVCIELIKHGEIACQLWSCVTDLPFPPSKLSQTELKGADPWKVDTGDLLGSTF